MPTHLNPMSGQWSPVQDEATLARTATAALPLDLALPASASFHFVFSNKTAHDSVCLEVVASLKSLGIKVWQQTTSIPKDSTNWFKEWYPNAVKALKIVCFISVAYLKSEFCMKEMSVALSCRNALIVTLDPLDDIMGVEKELQQYPWASDALAYLRTGGQVIVHLDVQRTVEDVIKFMPRLTSPPEPQLGSPPAGTGPKLSTIKTLSALAAASEETEEDLLAYDGDELSELFALFELDVVSKKKIKREIAARTEGGGSNSLDTGTPSSPGGAATQDLGAAQQMLQMQHQMQLMEQQRQMFDMQKLEMAQQAATVEAKVAADALAAQQRVDMAAKKSAEALQVTQAKLQAKSEKLEEQRAALQLQSAEIAQHMASMAAFEQHPNAIALTNPRYPNLPFDGFRKQRLFHQVNLDFPGLQLVHEKPYIFIVNGFLSQEECRTLLFKTQHLRPQEVGAASALARGKASFTDRKSNGCVLHNEELPKFRKRIAKLGQTQESHMQCSKISRYKTGDRFTAHTDATSPPDWRGGVYSDTDVYSDLPRARIGTSFCEHPGANVTMTVFVYLNNVTSGGRTRWRYTTSDPSFYDQPSPCNVKRIPWPKPNDKAGVHIAPEAGMAVLHFPSTLPETGGFTDRNANHEAEDAIDTKFICQQFIYSHPIDLEGDAPEGMAPRPGSKPDLSVTL